MIFYIRHLCAYLYNSVLGTFCLATIYSHVRHFFTQNKITKIHEGRFPFLRNLSCSSSIMASISSTNRSTGYGPQTQWQQLYFNGDERKFEQWEIRMLGYLKIRKLKGTICRTDEANLPADDASKNELAFAEICQFLDETSLELIIRDARDDGRKAFKILKEHYAGSSKPRVITLYTQLTTLQKSTNETITEYVLRAEKTAVALKTAGEQVSDCLLIAMALKGLPDTFKSFVTVITQSENEYTFQKFKQALRSHEETENTRIKSEADNVMHVSNNNDDKFRKPIICYKCGTKGHKADSCRKTKFKSKYCSNCKSTTHYESNCRKLHKANKIEDEVEENSHVFFKLSDDDFIFKNR